MRAAGGSESSKKTVVTLTEFGQGLRGGLEALEPRRGLCLTGTVVRADVYLPRPVAEGLRQEEVRWGLALSDRGVLVVLRTRQLLLFHEWHFRQSFSCRHDAVGAENAGVNGG